VAACQGGESDENAAGAPTIQLKADPSGAPRFLRTSFFAKPGETTIGFTNEASVGHNVTIVGPVDADLSSGSFEPIMRPDTETVTTETITNSSTSVTLDLKQPYENRATQYYFHCSVDGHESAGMWGVIIVKE
jgi:plastocyanin